MFVYVMKAGPHTKVGISKHPKRRVRSLTTANPLDVQLVGVVRTASAARIEREAHKVLAAFRSTGEWFKIEPLYALTVVEHLVDGRHSQEIVDACLAMQRCDDYQGKDWDDIFDTEWKPCSRLLETQWAYRDRVFFRL